MSAITATFASATEKVTVPVTVQKPAPPPPPPPPPSGNRLIFNITTFIGSYAGTAAQSVLHDREYVIQGDVGGKAMARALKAADPNVVTLHYVNPPWGFRPSDCSAIGRSVPFTGSYPVAADTAWQCEPACMLLARFPMYLPFAQNR